VTTKWIDSFIIIVKPKVQHPIVFTKFLN